MPEGPEIRRMVDDIHKAIGGKTAQSVFFAFEHLKPFESALRGRRVERVEARSKAVLVFFEATFVLGVENSNTPHPAGRNDTRYALCKA